MIQKKIRKHLSIFRTRLNQKKELERISRYNNTTLNAIVASLSKVKSADFTDEDHQAFQNCENYRTELLRDETLISYEIFGSDKTAMIKDICKNAASGKKWCAFLYLLSKKTNPSDILEIGTNLGISGCYVLESIKKDNMARFITMEGLPQLCKIAGKQFSSIASPSTYDIREGLFDVTFPQLLKQDIFFDLLFIDGNHTKDATIAYFKSLKDKIKPPAIFVFDDINWSPEMKVAWELIKNDSSVNFTIDLYKQGIVIIDEHESEKNVQFALNLAY